MLSVVLLCIKGHLADKMIFETLLRKLMYATLPADRRNKTSSAKNTPAFNYTGGDLKSDLLLTNLSSKKQKIPPLLQEELLVVPKLSSFTYN